MKHVDELTLLRYVEDKSGERESLEVDTHVYGCDDCLARLRSLLWLKDNFDAVWSDWNAAAHGEAVSRWQLAVALADAARISPSLSRRASAWLDRLADGAEVRVRTLLDGGKRIASLGASVLPGRFDARLTPVLAAVGSPELADLEDQLSESSFHLAGGDRDRALATMEQVIRIDSRVAQSSSMEIHLGDELAIRITADSRRRRIAVICWPVRGGRLPGAVLLLRPGSGAGSLAAEPRPVEGADYHLAEFNDLDEIDYIVVVGPLE